MMQRPSFKAILMAHLTCALVMTSAASGAEIEFIKGWDGHLFSSYIIATATLKVAEKPENDDQSNEVEILGDPQGLLGISIDADEDDQAVKVTIKCDAIMEPSSLSCTLSEEGETYIIHPKIKYKYGILAKQTQTGPITVTYEVQLGDSEPEEHSETLTLCSINDCPYSILKDGSWTSVRFMFAAYVNEQHPFVDNVLREALDTRIVDSFTGYQTKKKSEVYKQVYALWHALSQRDVRYSSVTNTAAICDAVGSQHVRLIDESINNGQANCVDGSVLFASLLRKINIEPLLVHVPGHCYLAFLLDEEGKSLSALETTMIGSEIEGQPIKVKGLEDVVSDDLRTENSWKTFSAAIATGTANYEKYQKNFQDPNDHNYALISIVRARKSGILPIGFNLNQKFIGSPKRPDAEDSDDDAK